MLVRLLTKPVIVTSLVKTYFVPHDSPCNTVHYGGKQITLWSLTETAFSQALSSFSLPCLPGAFSPDVIHRLLTSTYYDSQSAVNQPRNISIEKLVRRQESKMSMYEAIECSKLFAAALATFISFLDRLTSHDLTVWTTEAILEELALFEASGAPERVVSVIESSNIFNGSLRSHDSIADLLVEAAEAVSSQEEVSTVEEGNIDRIEDYMVCPTIRRPTNGFGVFAIMPLL